MKKVLTERPRTRTRKIGAIFGVVAMGAALMFAAPARSEEPKDEVKLDKSLSNLKIGLLGYIDYSAGQGPLPGDESRPYNSFSATRGYLTVEKSFLPWLGARITLDISQDKGDKLKIDDTEWDPGTASNVDRTEEYPLPSDLEGSFVVRIKYLYAVIKPADLGPLTNMKSELGISHIPWLDFEEHINLFRCQGTMPIERAGVLNSADLGAGLMGYFGEALEDAEGKTGNKSYAGRYGSWHLGVYNGSGYHSSEKNQNKVFEGRVTVRPIPDLAPGLQLSYFYLTGDGNSEYAFGKDQIWPMYRVQMGMLSFEHPNVAFAAQYFATDGNAKGSWIYSKHSRSLPTLGYSGFLNIRFPAGDGKLHLIGRYDYFDMDPRDKLIKDGETAYIMTVYGVAYEIYKGNMIMFAYENTAYQDDANTKTRLPVKDNELGREDKFQAVYQIKL